MSLHFPKEGSIILLKPDSSPAYAHNYPRSRRERTEVSLEKVSLVGAGRTSVSLKKVLLKTSSQTLPSNFFTLEPEISIEKGRKPSKKSISGQTARSCLTERQPALPFFQLIPLLLLKMLIFCCNLSQLMIQFVDGYMYILGNSLCNLRREGGRA